MEEYGETYSSYNESNKSFGMYPPDPPGGSCVALPTYYPDSPEDFAMVNGNLHPETFMTEGGIYKLDIEHYVYAYDYAHAKDKNSYLTPNRPSAWTLLEEDTLIFCVANVTLEAYDAHPHIRDGFKILVNSRLFLTSTFLERKVRSYLK